MNQQAEITVHGNVGWSVAENMMSGAVRVQGCAPNVPELPGTAGCLVIEGDASSRCGISLKGLDIVVGGSVGHSRPLWRRPARLVVCGDAAHGLGDSLYEAVIYVRGTIEGLGTDAREEPMSRPTSTKLSALLASRGIRRRSRGNSNGSPRPARCITGTSTSHTLTRLSGRCAGSRMTHESVRPPLSLEESASFDRHVLNYIHQAAESGLYDIRGLGAKRRIPTFDDLVFLTASVSRYPLEGYREKCVTKTVLGTRFAKKPIELEIPITVAGMSFRCPVGQRQRSASDGCRPRRARRRQRATGA